MCVCVSECRNTQNRDTGSDGTTKGLNPSVPSAAISTAFTLQKALLVLAVS